MGRDERLAEEVCGCRRGGHLTLLERGIIQAGLRAGKSLRAIAREVGCSPSTVANEVLRGTPKSEAEAGRSPEYDCRLGQAVYEEPRLRCHRPDKVREDMAFMPWLVGQVRGRGWSLDSCVGHARRENLFRREEIPYVKSLYNALHAGRLSLKVFDFSEVLAASFPLSALADAAVTRAASFFLPADRVSELSGVGRA